ncbi:MAG: FAD-dependent oxidoreductase [Gammaproteobacteria bacterium]
MQICVIGAGVAGLACATELVARGVSVTVVDRACTLGADACSWWAGGMLAPECERESAEEPVARLGAEAPDWWERHAGGVTRNGTLVLAPGRDGSDLSRFSRRTQGFTHVNGERIAALEPDLAGRFHRGLLFAAEAHLNPRAALATLASRLSESGVDVRFATDGADAPPADVTLDCRGLAARDDLPDLRGVKGEMLLIRSLDIRLSRPIRLLHPRIPMYIVPREDALLMVGATSIESNERNRITARSMMELLNGAYALHPALGEAEIVEIGVDARPAFPDNLPRLHRRGRTIHVNGLYRHGFLLAPALARMAAEAVLDEHREPALADTAPGATGENV